MFSETLSIEEFNQKHAHQGLVLRVATGNNFARVQQSQVAVDYRAEPNTTLAFNSRQTTSKTLGLFRGRQPVGVATLIIEPESTLKQVRGLYRHSSEQLEIVGLESVTGKMPEYIIQRGWRTVTPELRGQGIGRDLRQVISYEINQVLLNAPTNNIGFAGFVASSLTQPQREVVHKIIQSGTPIFINQLPLEIRNNIGKANSDSFSAAKGYQTDGYQHHPNHFFPLSYGEAYFLKQ